MPITTDPDNPLSLSITFPFHPKRVEAVKDLPGRRYNPKTKAWAVHIDHVDKVVDKLTPLGIGVSPEVELLTKTADLASSSSSSSPLFPSFPLFPFQLTGARRISASAALLLADVPGLGKTIQTIAGLSSPAFRRVLILCPASLKFSWLKEIQKWTPSLGPGSVVATVIDGKKEDRQSQWSRASSAFASDVSVSPANISPTWVIANYELLLRDYDEILGCGRWDAIVADEATRLSNSKSLTSRALKTLSASKKVALTGTPISNSPCDFWSIFDWIRPGYLGSFSWFQDRYAERDYWGSIKSYKNLPELSSLCAPFILRRTKEEVFKDFPPKLVEDIEFELSDKEKSLYEKIKNELSSELAEFGSLREGIEKTLGIIPVKMLRLKQVTDHPSLIANDFAIEDSSKLKALFEILEPIMSNLDGKVIIFTQFAQMAKILVDVLQKWSPLLLTGDVSSQERQRLVDLFNNDPKFKIFISTEAGGMGINLQAASYVVNYDTPWSIAKLTQRSDRAHRIGQRKPVTVYNLIARKTIDEYVAKTIHKKQKFSTDLLHDAERLEATGLGMEDIKAILNIE